MSDGTWVLRLREAPEDITSPSATSLRCPPSRSLVMDQNRAWKKGDWNQIGCYWKVSISRFGWCSSQYYFSSKVTTSDIGVYSFLPISCFTYEDQNNCQLNKESWSPTSFIGVAPRLKMLTVIRNGVKGSASCATLNSHTCAQFNHAEFSVILDFAEKE